MVPKIHAKGTSFRGLAAYLLHDKNRAKTSDRVEWVEVKNLITDQPDVAWRVMAATAMDQDRLKAMSGVKSTGRKSDASVLHFSLAWHPSEKAGLTREEMLRSAYAAIRALKADDRQAMIICHNDENHPHIHVVVNRVSPLDGKMLPSSKEKLNLSRWAEHYEKERGQVLCEERVLNNEARRRGQFTRGAKDQARHIYEQAPANDNSAAAKTTKAEQKKKDASVGKQVRETKKRHREQWKDLQQRFRQRNAGIKAQAVLDTAIAKETVRARFRPDYFQLMQEHRAEMVHFLKNEKSFLGRVSNALRSIDFKALVGGRAIDPERRQTIGEAFDALSSSGARLQMLKDRQAKQKADLEKTEWREERQAARQVRTQQKAKLVHSRSDFQKERNDLILSQRLEGAKHRSDWKTRNEQRAEVWRKVKAKPPEDGHKPRDPALIAKARKLAEGFRERQKGYARDKDQDRERGD